jgi:hypothetical protein
MSRLKRLIHEIHRRSLWQVLLIYIGGALFAYQAVQGLTFCGRSVHRLPSCRTGDSLRSGGYGWAFGA